LDVVVFLVAGAADAAVATASIEVQVEQGSSPLIYRAH